MWLLTEKLDTQFGLAECDHREKLDTQLKLLKRPWTRNLFVWVKCLMVGQRYIHFSTQVNCRRPSLYVTEHRHLSLGKPNLSVFAWKLCYLVCIACCIQAQGQTGWQIVAALAFLQWCIWWHTAQVQLQAMFLQSKWANKCLSNTDQIASGAQDSEMSHVVAHTPSSQLPTHTWWSSTGSEPVFAMVVSTTYNESTQAH